MIFIGFASEAITFIPEMRCLIANVPLMVCVENIKKKTEIISPEKAAENEARWHIWEVLSKNGKTLEPADKIWPEYERGRAILKDLIRKLNLKEDAKRAAVEAAERNKLVGRDVLELVKANASVLKSMGILEESGKSAEDDGKHYSAKLYIDPQKLPAYGDILSTAKYPFNVVSIYPFVTFRKFDKRKIYIADKLVKAGVPKEELMGISEAAVRNELLYSLNPEVAKLRQLLIDEKIAETVTLVSTQSH